MTLKVLLSGLISLRTSSTNHLILINPLEARAARRHGAGTGEGLFGIAMHGVRGEEFAEYVGAFVLKDGLYIFRPS